MNKCTSNIRVDWVSQQWRSILFKVVLNRQFIVLKPDQVWVTDITTILTNEGWLYLAVMIDLSIASVIQRTTVNTSSAKIIGAAGFKPAIAGRHATKISSVNATTKPDVIRSA